MDLQLNLTTTLLIITVTSLVSIVAFQKREIFEKWLYNPFMVVKYGQYYRIFTHALLHGGWMHLFFNMYVLYMFNQDHVYVNYQSYGVESSFEQAFGNWHYALYLGLYLGAIVAASVPGMIKHRNNIGYRSIGASGGVSAIVFAFILFHPTHELGLLFIPFGVPAFIFGPLYLILESVMNRRGGTGIAHDAHIWGGVFGFVFPILLKPQLFFDFIEIVQAYLLDKF